MRTEISKYSNGHAWRVFKTDFYILPRTVENDDYLKFCDIIDQIFTNLFRIDDKFSQLVPYQYFKCTKALFDEKIDIRPSKHKKAKIQFDLITPNYTIKFDFMFLEVEKFYVFDTCDFYVSNQMLLSKLPMKIDNSFCAHCSSHFSENQQYNKTYMTYIHTVTNPKKINNKHTTYSLDDCHHLYYKFCVKNSAISLNLEYFYDEYLSSSGFSKDPSKYFSIKLDDIDNVTLLKLTQINSLLSFYSSGFDVSAHYPEINYYYINDAQKMKWFIYDFLESPDDETDNILLLEMMKI